MTNETILIDFVTVCSVIYERLRSDVYHHVLSFACNFSSMHSYVYRISLRKWKSFRYYTLQQNSFFCSKKNFNKIVIWLFWDNLDLNFCAQNWKKKIWTKNWILEFASVCFTLHWKLLTFENSFSTRSDLQTKHHLEYQNCLSNFRSLRNVVRIWKKKI